ncbi:hypothetical protein ES703_25294 [subsurface metagenome]
MNYFLAQIILAARKDDDKGWINIVFIVALAIFYAVGSIIKAKKSKAEQKGDEQLARKPPVGIKDLQKQPLERPRRPAGPPPRRQFRPQVQPPRRKVMRPRPAVQKPAAKLEQEVEFETIEPLEAPKVSPPISQLQVDLEELPEFTSKPLKELEDKRVGVPSETAQPEVTIEPLLDYADTDELKRAILHYEILGRPLSLRGPSEHIIGL